MTGYELPPDSIAFLVKVASRHHRKQLAGLMSLIAHMRRGKPYFRNVAGLEVSIADMCQLLQVDHEVQRKVYNLYMYYAHFG